MGENSLIIICSIVADSCFFIVPVSSHIMSCHIVSCRVSVIHPIQKLKQLYMCTKKGVVNNAPVSTAQGAVKGTMNGT